MASYSITSIGKYYVNVQVTGLTIGDKVHFFVRLADDTSDTTIDEYVTATATSLVKTLSGLQSNTDYIVNIGIVVGDVNTWIGAKEFTTLGEERPEDWEWWNTIKSGGTIKLEADEWNDFCDRINEFREYAGLDEYDFTRVYSGDSISAEIANEARSAINEIENSGTVPSRVYSGDPLAADFFLDLRDALNAIE